MRNVLRVLGVAAVLGGCAGDEPAPVSQRLRGTWLLEDAVVGFKCTAGLSFLDDNRYEDNLLCDLEGGGYGLQSVLGYYSIDGNEITTSPAKSTCAETSTESKSVRFELLSDDRALRLVTPSGIIVLERFEATPGVNKDGSGSSASVPFGCFGTDGGFDRTEIYDL